MSLIDQQQLKRQVAEYALRYIQPQEILGVGTGSTVNCLIELLPQVRDKIKACVSSSEQSTIRLKKMGFTVIDLNQVTKFSVYIDGADEANSALQLIKGGGAALTREKIVCAHADKFVCVIDQSKQVQTLGQFPLPLEVIPMAAEYVIRQLSILGASARIRPDCITDNGNVIVDVSGLQITDPIQLEQQLNGIVGIVENGLFAIRPADHLIIATTTGIQVIDR